MTKLTKSLEELDAAADELLAKSQTVKKSEDTEDQEVAPEEVSDDTTSTPESENEEDEEKVEKCDTPDGDNLKKSEDEGDSKAEDEETEEEVVKSETAEEDTPEELDEEEEEKSPEDMEKSIKDDFEAEEVISKGIQESEFFSAVVDAFAKSLGDMQFDMQSQGKNQGAAMEVIAKSMQAALTSNRELKAENEKLTRRINKLEKSISQGFERVMDSLDEISSQPAGMRKSVSSFKVQERDFDSSLNGHATIGGFDSLSKSQVLEVLNNELYAGNPNVTASDIIGYESGAPLRNDLQSLVERKCK